MDRGDGAEHGGGQTARADGETERDARAQGAWRYRAGRLALPAAMVPSGIVSVQVGPSIAARLFHEVPPAAVTGLRL